MKDIILKFILEHFGEEPNEHRKVHFSYCRFPEDSCTCKGIEGITYDTSLIGGGYIDSFSMVVVLVFLQKTFNIKIPDKEAIPGNFDTVNKMVELVNRIKK